MNIHKPLPRAVTITAQQSYSLVIRDMFFEAVMAMPFFAGGGFTGRKCKAHQIQPQDMPFLGLYIVSEEFVPDGDGNAGHIAFVHTLKLGFSVVMQNNDIDVSEQKMDAAFWAIMNGLWRDEYITNMLDTQAYGHPAIPSNPDNVRIESVSRGMRRHLWGDTKLTNETPVCEMQCEVSVVYRTEFGPVIDDDLLNIHVETVPLVQGGVVPPADEVQRIISEYDFDLPL